MEIVRKGEIMQRCECCWAVTAISPDDGHRVPVAYFTDLRQANDYEYRHSGLEQPAVVQVELYKEGERYYKITKTEVQVNLEPLRRSALAKLTDAEKRALGVA